MTILANLQNINLAFGQKALFSNAGLTISDQDRIGLIGLNGYGKSTLLKIIWGTLIPDSSNPPFIYDRNKQLSLCYIPQEIDISQFPDLTSENFYLAFDEDLRKLHRELKTIEKKLETEYENELLLHQQDDIIQKIQSKGGWNQEQNYQNYLKHYKAKDQSDLTHLSGGELKKLSLASGMSHPANLVLWDEPTNHLDIQTIERFEDDIASSQKAFIMISHDRYLLSNICNKIIHIQNGQIHSFQGNYLQYLEHLEEKEQERLKNLDTLENKHRRELAWMRQGIKARGTRSKKRVETFHNIKSDIQSLKNQTKKIVSLSMEHSGRKTKKLIEIENGVFGYNKETILQNININAFKNDKIALVGNNGQGKTTLIKILTQDLVLNSGSFYCADQIKISVFAQNRNLLDDNKTPFTLVGDGQDFVHLPDGRTLHVNSYLEKFLFLSDQIRRPIKTLSGGEKNRLQLALFMKEASDLWVFDEPTNDLDIETIEVLEQMLKEYQNAVIIISHDRAFLDNIVNKSWVIHDKTVDVFEGGYTQIAPYLHALELESELPQEVEVNNIEVPEDDSDKPRMNNKEKMRWKVIDDEIQKAESLLSHLTSALGKFDFQNMTAVTKVEYDEVHKQQIDCETLLENLYEEWETLSQKKI